MVPSRYTPITSFSRIVQTSRIGRGNSIFPCDIAFEYPEEVAAGGTEGSWFSRDAGALASRLRPPPDVLAANRSRINMAVDGGAIGSPGAVDPFVAIAMPCVQ